MHSRHTNESWLNLNYLREVTIMQVIIVGGADGGALCAARLRRLGA
jgi:hypothetical protein